MFNKKPMCELCGEKEAISFSLLCDWKAYQGDNRLLKMNGKWKFICDCVSEERWIKIEDFFKTPAATVDNLAHAHQKEYVDWDEFMDMIVRFRKATDSYFA